MIIDVFIPGSSSASSSGSSKGKKKVKRAEILDTDVPEIVESGEGEVVAPNIEGLLGGSSLFGGEDVDLEHLLVGLLPQQPTSTSGSSDEVIIRIHSIMIYTAFKLLLRYRAVIL